MPVKSAISSRRSAAKESFKTASECIGQIQKNISLFAITRFLYAEATANITTNGSIVLHPRTGAPIENPYLKIQTQQSSIIAKFKHIKSNSALLQ